MHSQKIRIQIYKAVFRIRPEPKLLGLKDQDLKFLILDPASAQDLDLDPPLFHNKIRIIFEKFNN